jgi:hypothetical protein
MQTEKIWGKETFKLKTTYTWKSKWSEDKLVVMDYNLHVDSMQQIQHKSFEQNPYLLNISVKKCRQLGMPTQQGIDHKRDKRYREC